MLVVIGGLPGVGKSTIAGDFARLTGASWLRIDLIEQAIRDADVLADDVGPAGYMAAYALAGANLKLGHTVIADAANALEIARSGWRDAADAADAALLQVEIVCSDRMEHRRRVETRERDIPGLRQPGWSEVEARHWEPWPDARLRLDSASMSAEDAAASIAALMQSELRSE